MVDITQKPFFGYNHIIDELLAPLRNIVDIRLQGFDRTFPDRKRILICYDYDWNIDYFTISTLYRYGVFEGDPTKLETGYNMWDHLQYAPPQIYTAFDQKWGLGHGLTVVKQYGDYVDTFVFATDRNNQSINNFYLNHKDKIEGFIEHFYQVMEDVIRNLLPHAIVMPPSLLEIKGPTYGLSQRQRECGHLLVEGKTAKEIARFLSISSRTVEDHLNVLRTKLGAKNRIELVKVLAKMPI